MHDLLQNSDTNLQRLVQTKEGIATVDSRDVAKLLGIEPKEINRIISDAFPVYKDSKIDPKGGGHVHHPLPVLDNRGYVEFYQLDLDSTIKIMAGRNTDIAKEALLRVIKGFMAAAIKPKEYIPKTFVPYPQYRHALLLKDVQILAEQAKTGLTLHIVPQGNRSASAVFAAFFDELNEIAFGMRSRIFNIARGKKGLVPREYATMERLAIYSELLKIAIPKIKKGEPIQRYRAELIKLAKSRIVFKDKAFQENPIISKDDRRGLLPSELKENQPDLWLAAEPN